MYSRHQKLSRSFHAIIKTGISSQENYCDLLYKHLTPTHTPMHTMLAMGFSDEVKQSSPYCKDVLDITWMVTGQSLW